MNYKTKERLDIVKYGSLTLIVGALIAWSVTGIIKGEKSKNEYKQKVEQVSEILYDKINNDLKTNQSEYEFDTIAVSFMNIDTPKSMKVNKKGYNAVSVYGTIPNAVEKETQKECGKSFKAEYVLSNEYVLRDKASLDEFVAEFENATVNSIEFDDVEALIFGMSSAEQLQDFTKAVYKVDDYKHNQGSILEYAGFIPLNSVTKTEVVDGKTYAAMSVTGIDAFNKKKSNMGAGLALGYLTYGWASNSSSFSSSAASLGLMTGIAASEVFAEEKLEKYFCETTYSVEIDGSKEYTQDQLRDMVVDAISNKKEVKVSNEKYSKEIGDISFYKYANKTFEKKAEAEKGL